MEELVMLCRACSLEELAQAGGGNISVKQGDILYIKASGVSLSDVTHNHGYVAVNNQKVLNSLQLDAEPDIMSFIVSGTNRPSLETYFHSFLGKYVVHLHPTCMNSFLCSISAELIDYERPGFFLSKKILQHYAGQSVIYLKNHGVIFHSETYQGVLELIKQEHNKFKKIWSTDLTEFWNIQDEYLTDFIYKVPYLETLQCIDILRKPLIPMTPDIVLFLHDSIIVKNNSVYIRAKSKQKCLSILEVLRCYSYSYDQTLTFLNESEVSEILNWDVEKYRKSKP
jgi:ribulose-5-phosphate 4-epimerase/fuculose-1-phosphate aldolase